MSNTELIRKKSIALSEATHARLMEVVGFLQAKRGVNTTANQALEVLLEGWDALLNQAESNKIQFEQMEDYFITDKVMDFIIDNIAK
jgi:hypothetical protein